MPEPQKNRSAKPRGPYARVGNAIRGARLNRGWTLRELAPKVGIHFTYLAKIERGHEAPGLALLARLEKTLGAKGLLGMRKCPTCGRAVDERVKR